MPTRQQQQQNQYSNRTRMSRHFNSESIKIELGPEFHKEIRNHALEVQRKEEDFMREKMERQMEKVTRVKEIQNNFVKWVERKTVENQAKIDKVEKNKEEHINRIVKKCKERDTLLNKKHEDFKIARRKNMNIAWKKAEKFNDDIQNYYKSKRIMSKTIKASLEKLSGHEDDAVASDAEEKKEAAKAINTPKLFVTSYPMDKIEGKVNIKEREREKKHENYMRAYSSNLNEGMERKKSLEILDKARNYQRQVQKNRIQELGQKMVKIQQSRARKMKRNDRKTTKEDSPDHDHNTRSRNLSSMENRYHKQRKTLGSIKKDEGVPRLHSEQFNKNESRIKDRSEDYRLKRNQMFQRHLMDGYEYLQNLKVRHLKTVIAKNISYNAMQKKLYMERFLN